MASAGLPKEFIEKIQAVAGQHMQLGEQINADFAHDEMPIYGSHMPDMAVEVHSTEETAEIVRLCNEYQIPVTPRGAGTGLVGGAVPVSGGVLLSMTKMNQILGYDLDNFVVQVQAGVLLHDLIEDTSKHGLLYPPDPGEKFATLGGNVSTNAGGMRAVKYGTTRDYVCGMTVVLPTGEILRLGGAVSKNSSGYSLMHLIIGSEGTLGIITELTLKLIPQPGATVSMICPFPNLESCIAAVPQFQKNHIHPQALEFMETEIVQSAEAYVGKTVFPKTADGQEICAYLLLTLDGDDLEQIEPMIEKTAEIAIEAGAIDAFLADTPNQKRDIWQVRGAFLEAILDGTTYLDECDVVVPISKIAQFLCYVNGLQQQFGLQVKSFGHAGDGNLHIYACSSTGTKEEFLMRAEKFMDAVYVKAAELKGQVSGEHGIGYGKQKYLKQSLGDVSIQLMREIKKAFDPHGILNPGKVCWAE